MNLNFKYGLFEKLANQAINPGTVYVTADEKAMYVDMPAIGDLAEQRIRINQIIVKDSVIDVQPPYSEDAFYYFVKENALLIWTDVDQIVDGQPTGNKVKGWQQVNSVAGVQTQLNALRLDVDGLITDVETLEGYVGVPADKTPDASGNYKDTLFGEIGRIDADLSDIHNEIGVVDKSELPDADLEGIKSTGIYGYIAAEKARAEAAEATNATDISDLADAIGTKDDEKTADTLWGALKAEIARATEVEGNIDSKVGTAQDVAAEDGSLYARLAHEIARAEAAEKTLRDDLGQEITDRIEDVNAEEDRAKKEEARIEALITGEKGLNNRVESLEKVLTGDPDVADDEGLVGAVAKNTSDINTNATDIAELDAVINGSGEGDKGLVGAVDKNADDIAALNKIVSGDPSVAGDEGLVGDVEDLLKFKEDALDPNTGFAAEIDSLNTKIEGLEEADGKLDQRIKDLETTVNDSNKGVKANAKAIDDIQLVLSGDGTDANAGLISLVAKNAENIGANATDISTLQTDLGTLADKVNDKDTGLAATYGIASANAAKIGTAEIYGDKDLSAAANDLDNRVKALKQEVDDHSTTLSGLGDKTVAEYVADSISDSLAAADAMTFKGPITKLADLPVVNVEAGWTYVVTETFSEEVDGKKTTYYVGDMLVANEDLAASTLDNWTHVKSGFWKENQALTVKADGQGNTSLLLVDGTGEIEISEIKIKGEGVKVTSGAANELVVSMTWEQFA